uniref:Uncharacterized protein n=1 Tax=Heterosigma akashiwo TaxID=2829 RepID=A0A7S3Y0G6_HETAK
MQGMVNVTNKRCEHKGGIKRPVFHCKGEFGGSYWGEHKLQGTVDAKNKGRTDADEEHCKSAICQYSDCTKISVFNYFSYGTKKQGSKFCKNHKQEGMVDVRDIVVVKEEEV